MDKKNYGKYTESRMVKSNIFANTVAAFLSGGLICVLGQALGDLYTHLNIPTETVKLLVPVSLIFLTCFITGLGFFDKLAKFAGAGTIVPITGFANAVISPAIDTKNEGLILGLGAKLFIIAGPVIVYGVLLSVLYGVIYYIVKLF